MQDWKEQISIRNMGQSAMDLSDCNVENESTGLTARNGQLLSSSLCYACHTTLTSRSSRNGRKVTGIGDAIHSVPLPTWVSKNLCEESLARGMKMREQIQEFLIDPNDEDSKSSGNI